MARPAQVMGDGAPELDWELLYDLYAPRLRRVIQRRVPRGVVEEVLQEAFLQAFKSRATVDAGRPIYPWLVTIAVRTSTEWGRRQLRTLPVVGEPLAEVPEPALDSLEEEVLNRARRVGIKHAFASLNGRQRRLLQLVTIEGMSYERAAECEGISTEAARSAIARARTNFKTSYSDFGKETGLFGVAGFGAILKCLRRRFREYQAVAAGHVAGVGATAATVAVVAVAVAPIVAAQTRTSAAEPAATANTPSAATAAPNAPAVATDTSNPTAAHNAPKAAPAAVTTTVTVTRTRNAGVARVGGGTTSDTADTRTTAWITFHCDTAVGHAGCAAVDATAPIVGP